jgi:xanthine dehydrogenase YagS FAD-binding subunit
VIDWLSGAFCLAGHETVPGARRLQMPASLDPLTLRSAAAFAADGARGQGHNDFKIELMQRAIVRAVETAGARA